MAANVLTNQTWELSAEYVPVPLQNKLISQCFLELLHLGPGANHAILRLVFKHPQVEASPRAPAGTLGLILNLEINGAIAAPSVPGEFVVRTLTAAGPHPKAVQSAELPVRGRKRVSNFLAVLKTAHLLPCTFNYIYPDAVGCRDFT
ncbi:unnamed protein product [Penicillium olsonii]|nr:unnamed protein product [Penicillium olsonii]CAG7929835.1 unnamed protein product [Penicillium olsonii]